MTSRLPLRIRLTLWYGLLLAATLVIFAALLYVGLRWRLNSSFDDQLNGQAQLVMATLQTDDDELESDLSRVNEGEEEYLVRLIDKNGHTVAERGYGADQVPVDLADFQRVLNGKRVYSTINVHPDVHLRILSLPVHSSVTGETLGVVQVGLDHGDVDDTLSELLIALVVLIPLAVAVAIGGGYVLAGQTLRPLARITDLARSMSERDLHERLHLDLPDDELGRLANTFDAMLARIEVAFERQRRFTGDAAHELRTPLTLMRSQIDLALARPRSSEAYRDALQSLDADLSRVTSMTETLLSLARLDNTANAPTIEAFDLGATIATTLEMYQPALDEAGIVLNQTITPMRIHADEDMIIQVLVNLLDNAMAHTPAGGSISVEDGMTGNDAWVTVTDTGSGIPEDHQARVFDRFYRPDSGRARNRGGAGLGLAICKAIVESHGGTITLTSTVGIGTTVRFTLPRR